METAYLVGGLVASVALGYTLALLRLSRERELRARLEERDRELEGLQQQCQMLDQERARAQQEGQALKESLIGTQTSLQNEGRRCAEQAEHLKTLEEQLSSAREERRRIEVSAAEAQASIENERKRTTEHSDRSQQLEKHLSDAHKTISELEKQLAELHATLKSEQNRLAEQERVLAEAEASLKDAFKALAADTLKSNSEAFIALAKRTLDAELTRGKTDIEAREKAIKELVGPLGQSLSAFHQEVQGLEQERHSKLGELGQQIRQLHELNQQLSRDTNALVAALRQPRARGKWGELTLRRVAELAGMSEHCDFAEQVSVDTEDGRLRPDMIVHLPADRDIVVDAKVPLDAYLDGLEAETEDVQQAALGRHATQLRQHIQNLSGKAYWAQFQRAPEFVVLFLPNEAMFSAALHVDKQLIEFGFEKRVFVGTPTNLIALLLVVAHGWRQAQLAETAAEISELGRSLFDRIAVLADHFQKIGDALERTVKAYNAAVGSLETRVLPDARRFKYLGAAPSGKEIVRLEPVDEVPRPLAATADLLGDSGAAEEEPRSDAS